MPLWILNILMTPLIREFKEAISNAKSSMYYWGTQMYIHECVCKMSASYKQFSSNLSKICVYTITGTVYVGIQLCNYSAFFLWLWTRHASNLHLHIWDGTGCMSITPVDPVKFIFSSMFTSKETVVAVPEPPPSTITCCTILTVMVVIVIVKGAEWFSIMMPQCVMEPWRFPLLCQCANDSHFLLQELRNGDMSMLVQFHCCGLTELEAA